MTVNKVEFHKSGAQAESDNPNDTILDIADDAGVPIESLCRGGTCGICKVRLLEGRVHEDADWGLSEEEKEAGWILTCSSRPDGRCVVDA